MTRERWQQVCDLLEQALELTPQQRPALLDRACGADPSLRQEVEVLLASSDHVRSSFLQGPPLVEPTSQTESTPKDVLTPGVKLGPYLIQSLIGSGGMGEVYRARDTELKREVAIKVLPEFWSRDPERLHRFELEAQAAAALNHPNIISIHHVGQHEGSPYIVTELLQGETLRERLRRGPVPLRKTIEYTVQIANGLAAAHDRGIVHRDLKPENLFVTKDGRVKILDFGLARLVPSKEASGEEPTVTQRTGSGVVLGTAGYMSPEQVRGKTADHRADIFAFGTILYEMATGKQPFRKSTSAETMTAILNEDPPSISQITPAASPGMQRVVHRCLEKDPEQRFHSAHDLAFALEALSDSSSSSIATTIDQGSRLRWAWAVTAAVVVVLAAGLVAWWKTPLAVPVVESVTQLTDDGEPKGNLVSDGSRLYFNEGPTRSWKIAQVSTAGGRTALFDTRLESPGITALAPDGSALLTLVSPGGILEYGITAPLWSIPLPAGEPRRLGSFEAQDAGFFPDGRIIFTKGSDLFVAEKDGSNPRKLVSVAGSIWGPSVSPDGQRMVVEISDQSAVTGSMAELAADGTGLHTILNFSQEEWGSFSSGVWSSDGKYIVYELKHGSGSDLWALPMRPGIFQRSREPIRLTNGPLSYSDALPSRDGKQIFALGTKRRGELVRYDMKSHQFLSFLSGISATNPTFSRDGQWVAYLSYPDLTLWRSRSDGSERRQLTYPPMEVSFPFISPDGMKVVFTNASQHYDETYVVSMDGGLPQKVVESHSIAANWSPDGNLLIMGAWAPAPNGKINGYSQILDLRTGKISVVPSSQGMSGGHWLTQDTLIAANRGATKFSTFDFKTQKWSDLLAGNFRAYNLSPDGKYFYFTTGGTDPKVQRLRLADRQIETITSLKDFREKEGGSDMTVAPDGSPIFTRDIGTQEIYALRVKWP